MFKYTSKEVKIGNSKTSVMLMTSNAMLPAGANTPTLSQFSLTHIDKYLTQTPFFLFLWEAGVFEEVHNFQYLCLMSKGTFSSV